ncbi:uncharacterized protein M421DRAFT_222049 [Didymella exigua CBS 183.55]|uniref:Uncharacterized protein n=1 Tax=Didymella exigua CBS 183.55 TaxID=1150837 RepID=A0A6A5RL70_9PLEO|nr:uncharacterized protein M421DRAFT_222049 [Didymella exigua CBS 183.55]KAF1926287.1 hypothetical protein M421DRAFT_222049 [Didymella exigua CBS 183.55]
MSRASQITLATTCAVAIGTVGFVHFSQRQDKAAMHAGVIRDYEQQRVKTAPIVTTEIAPSNGTNLSSRELNTSIAGERVHENAQPARLTPLAMPGCAMQSVAEVRTRLSA